ncbi:MAG: hypothetical protein OEM62_04175 [Acidobacteriota bacterium]|nr:hypothetical protein [Acidobacteriota bacterium]
MMLFLIYAAAIIPPVGLIWFVHVIHSSLFDFVSERPCGRLAAKHQPLTSLVAASLIITLLGTALICPVARGSWSDRD